MIRDLPQFQTEEYDLVIVGGGIYGATICWEAVSRGLKVALFEKSDFGSATSANSLKIIHGGFRYLQNGDLSRVKESIKEQRILMHIAPHLVHPIPVLVPIYGHGLKGKEAFTIGLKVFDYIRSSENQLEDPDKHIPGGRILSKGECINLLPDLRQEGLNGGAVFFDAQAYNSERLVISFLQTAWQIGAHIANYAEVIGFIEENRQVKGVQVKDVLTGDTFHVASKIIAVASGPWNDEILSLLANKQGKPTTRYAKAINLVTHKIFNKFAVGVRGKNQYFDGRYLPNSKNSFLFVTPWRDFSIIGTAYSMTDKKADDFEVNEKDISFLKNEFNQVYPGVKLSRRDILFAHGGLLPVSGKKGDNVNVNLSKKFKIIDHRNYGYAGLVSIEGVKYTTARDVAQKTIDYIIEKWGYEDIPSTTASTRLYGGEINRFDDYLNEAVKSNNGDLSEPQIRDLVFNYGSVHTQVLDYLDDSPRKNGSEFQDFRLLDSQIRYAVDREMAQKLGDIIFRRTELGSAGNPGDETLKFSAQVMGRELNWSQSRIDEELEGVQKIYSQYDRAIAENYGN
ncbi:MAG: FAD-dependent oxidoreductase [Candidatus Kariarchaeaceae archaeon]